MDAIRQVKESVGDSVVIVSNGNVRNCAEAEEALDLTKDEVRKSFWAGWFAIRIYERLFYCIR